MLTKQEIKHYIIRARGLNKQGILYPSVIKLSKELNVYEILIPRDLEQEAVEKAREVFNWIEDHNGNYPKERSKDKIEKQYATWIGTQKKAKQGKGNGYIYYESVYKIFEKKYPHIFDLVDLEQESVEKARKVFNWIEDRGGEYPNNTSKDLIEKQYASWIQHQKSAKQGKGNGNKYYKSVYNVFESKYPHIFDTLEEQSIETAKEVLNWMDEHGGGYPKQHSKDSIEKQYATWIGTQKKAKQGKGIYYKSVYKIFEKKYPHIFDLVDLEQEAVKKAREVFNWIDKHGGKYPYQKSKNKIEQRYGAWLVYARRAKQDKGSYGYYKSVYNVFRSKYPHIFDLVDLEQEAVEKAHKVFNWIEDHGGKYPYQKSKNKIEQRYANWISCQKLAKQGKGNGSKYYENVYKIFEKKYPCIFHTVNLEQEAVENAKEVLNWIDEHNGNYPSQHSKDKVEQRYGAWICNQKRSKLGKGKGKYYKSVYNVFEKKYPKIFDIRS